MKKYFLITLVGVALATISFTNPPNTLVGRWQQTIPGGISVVTVYRAAGTFDMFVNGKAFVNGNYTVRQDTLAYSDPICGSGYYGTYKLAFITEDSIRLSIIQDSCQVRRRSISRVPGSGRVKVAK
jgi:hypothetical protein